MNTRQLNREQLDTLFKQHIAGYEKFDLLALQQDEIVMQFETQETAQKFCAAGGSWIYEPRWYGPSENDKSGLANKTVKLKPRYNDKALRNYTAVEILQSVAEQFQPKPTSLEHYQKNILSKFPGFDHYQLSSSWGGEEAVILYFTTESHAKLFRALVDNRVRSFYVWDLPEAGKPNLRMLMKPASLAGNYTSLIHMFAELDPVSTWVTAWKLPTDQEDALQKIPGYRCYGPVKDTNLKEEEIHIYFDNKTNAESFKQRCENLHDLYTSIYVYDSRITLHSYHVMNTADKMKKLLDVLGQFVPKPVNATTTSSSSSILSSLGKTGMKSALDDESAEASKLLSKEFAEVLESFREDNQPAISGKDEASSAPSSNTQEEEHPHRATPSSP